MMPDSNTLPAGEAAADYHGLTLLMIEDSSTLRVLLRQSLSRLLPGVTIVEAADGRQAIHELTRCRADLVLTDLQMPGVDGRSFLAKLRGNPLLRRKKVVVLSSDDVRDLRDLYVADDGIRFLAKPSEPAELVRTILELLPADASFRAPR